jgi:lysophospholipase L1-like esterase
MAGRNPLRRSGRTLHNGPRATVCRLSVMWLLIGSIAVAMLGAEVALRIYGLGQPLLYERMPYGYRVVPGQTLKRFGNRVFYNDYGLRSEPIAPTPPAGVLRVLCIGDSVTFGTTKTDQSQTYPYLVQRELERAGIRAEVLNASAGGWAVENEEGWLSEHGTLGSGIVIIQVATHDLFQKKASGQVVGNHPSFPDRKPVFALQELVSRYLLPRLIPGSVYNHDEEYDSRTEEDVARTLASLERIDDFVKNSGGQLMVFLAEHASSDEPADAITLYAKQALATRMRARGVPVVRSQEGLDAAGGSKLFYDPVHPNPQGNLVIARSLAAAVMKSRQAALGHRDEIAVTRNVAGAR